MVKENDIYKVIGVDYTSEGIGLAKVDGFPLFVNNLIIGEEAEVKVMKVMRKFALAKIIRFTQMSPDRITPLIPETIHLGGCQFTQLNYEKEVEYKLSKVTRALRVIGGIDYQIKTIHKAPNPYFYRNKTVLPLARKKNGIVISGMYRFNTHEIIAMEKTHLDDQRASEVMIKIRELLERFDISIYDEKTHSGDLRRVMLRASYYTKDLMVVFITKSKNVTNLAAFCNELVANCPQITTIVQNINPHRTNVILGDEEVVLCGDGIIQEKINDLTFKVSSKSFFQVNTVQAEKLYSRAIELAKLKKSDTVLDAYSGIGTITLLAAKKAKHAIGVEIVNQAVIDANVNRDINNIKNATFYVDDAGEFLVNYKELQKIDVVFVDPPRKGLSETFINKILEVKPPKIVYVSCDPATLARDLKILNKNYDIDTIECLDMFPRTAHVESIVILKLKN